MVQFSRSFPSTEMRGAQGVFSTRSLQRAFSSFSWRTLSASASSAARCRASFSRATPSSAGLTRITLRSWDRFSQMTGKSSSQRGGRFSSHSRMAIAMS